MPEYIIARDISGSGVSFTISGSTSVVGTDGYASASDVANLCRNLLNGVENFTASTSPTLIAINTWISSGCGIIETRLSTEGYVLPIAASTTLYGWIRDLNTLYAAARAEMSRTNITLGPGERTRGQVFDDLFWKQLEKVCDMDLTTVGATRSDDTIKGMTMYVGGTSKAEKGVHKSDSDRVEPRFSKGMFSMPGTYPVNSAEDNDD